MTSKSLTLDDFEGHHWQPVRSAILATAGLLVLDAGEMSGQSAASDWETEREGRRNDAAQWTDQISDQQQTVRPECELQAGLLPGPATTQRTARQASTGQSVSQSR